MSSESDLSEIDYEEIVPESIRQVAKTVSLDLLPKKLKQIYTAAYNAFKKWRKDHGSNSFCEDVMLAYFFDLSKKYAPSSLWSIYSKLRTTISTFDKTEISQYKKLISFLKKQNSGYRAKKSSTFTKQEISRFLNEAPDDSYLSTKVGLIFGITGGLRRQELTNLSIRDVTEVDDYLFVRINGTKNKVPRSFTISGELFDICKRYIQARPQLCTLDRFLFKYSNGKSLNQPIGINKFGPMPKEVAEYLKLHNADSYTGHSFRRTSATLLVDAGAKITTLKRHGGWKSSTVAEGYIAESINNKKVICQLISSEIVLNKQASDTVNEDSQQVPTSAKQILPNRSSIIQDSNIDTPSTSGTNNKIKDQSVEQCQEQKSQLFYDPAIGLFIMGDINKDSNKCHAFYNCDVHVESHPKQTIILNNCNITNADAKANKK